MRWPARLPATALSPFGTVTHGDSLGLTGTALWGRGHRRGMGHVGTAVGYRVGQTLWGRWGTQGSFQNRVLAEEMPATEKELICSL